MATVTAEAPAPDRLERAAYFAMLAFVASVQVSIAAANILLALTGLLWLALLATGRLRAAVPAMFWPLGAYAAVSLVSAIFSIDPARSLVDSKQLLLFAVVPLAYTLLPDRRSLTAVDVVISVAALSAAIGIVQFGIFKWDDLQQRPQGALGMYMTYSGQLMLVACLAVARVLFSQRDRVWPMLVLPALVVALATTASRNAWVGACSGIAILLLMRDLRLVGLLPVVAAIFIALAPAQLTDRFYAMFQIRDVTRQTATTEASVRSNQDRVAMVRVRVPHRPRSSVDRRRTRHGDERLSRVSRQGGGQPAESAPAQRAAADRGRARPARPGRLALVHRGARGRPASGSAAAAPGGFSRTPRSPSSPPCWPRGCSNTISAIPSS